MVELLPCPHCEAPARFVWGPRDHGSVKCTRPSCGARSGDFAHQSNAIAAWNTRATSAPSTAVGEWQDIASAPPASGPADERILVTGGAHCPFEVVLPDGEWWRKRKAEGSIGVPTHWAQIILPAFPTPDRAKEMDRG